VTAVHAVKAVMFAKTAGHVWAMPLSVHSAKPWRRPTWCCAAWPVRPMARC
jgi:hypothetical protein